MSNFNVDQKYCAKWRRSITKNEFKNISQILSVDFYANQHLVDDVKILRLAFHYIQLKHCLRNLKKSNQTGSENITCTNKTTKRMSKYHTSTSSIEQIYLKTDCTASIIMFTLNGECIYASKLLENIIGVPVGDFIGENTFDYLHPVDSIELSKLINTNTFNYQSMSVYNYVTNKIDRKFDPYCDGHTNNDNNKNDSNLININVRFKYLINGKLKYCKLSACTFNVVNLIGRIVNIDDKLSPNKFFVGIIIPLFMPNVQKYPLSPVAYVSKASLDMSFIWCNKQLLDFFHTHNLEPAKQSLYKFVGIGDIPHVKIFHNEVLKKCHAVSSILHLKTLHNNIVICKLRAHLVFDRKGSPNHIICVYLLLKVIDDTINTKNVINAFNGSHQNINNYSTNNNAFENSNNTQSDECIIGTKPSFDNDSIDISPTIVSYSMNSNRDYINNVTNSDQSSPTSSNSYSININPSMCNYNLYPNEHDLGWNASELSTNTD